MGVPQNGWLMRENPISKWMMTGGTPMTQDTSISWEYHGEYQRKYHGFFGSRFGQLAHPRRTTSKTKKNGGFERIVYYKTH